jgi:hypothetical protein
VTSGSGDEARARYRLALDALETGTLVGALTWVLGALEIMKDRGHAEGDEAFHELYQTLEPRVTALLGQIAEARDATGAAAGARVRELEEQIQQAYGAVRAAFEAWIELTAVDTASIAIEQRLAERGLREEGAE